MRPLPMDRLLFMAASALPTVRDRKAFLEYACEGDPSLREWVEELLEVEHEAGEFFELKQTTEVPDVPDGGAEGAAGARIGAYRLIERLGSGGCGVVYLAEQLEPVVRKVALKIIRPGMDTESVIARFEKERGALAMMDHPNIARVLDAGATASSRPYFVMELVFVQVCEAIQHAHQKGVVHRDIKPSNVLVREEAGRAILKVIDFGIAKATSCSDEAEATVTRSGQFLGTPAYMSPEQALGHGNVDTRADIYSLGALLCELLIGHPPFSHDQLRGQSVDEIRTILRDRHPGLPSARLLALPTAEAAGIASCRGLEMHRLVVQLKGDLDWIVMKSLEKERQRRYDTAIGLGRDIESYLRESPVLARPPSRRYLFGKLVRRNRVLFSAAGVALFGLVSGLGTSTWLFFREREARQEQTRLWAEAEVARANESRLYRSAQVADLVTQAAVMLRYREMEKADELI
jgi:eukaryotic-like serine/threonine-protein kinase